MSNETNATDPGTGERCPDCRHAPHDGLGFCPNMASDNDCACKRGATPAEPDAGDVAFERLLGEWQRGEIPVDVVLPRLAAVRREAEVKAGEEIAQAIEADDTGAWAPEHFASIARDRAARLSGA